MTDSFYTSSDHFTIIPAVMLVLFGCAILVAALARSRGSGGAIPLLDAASQAPAMAGGAR